MARSRFAAGDRRRRRAGRRPGDPADGRPPAGAGRAHLAALDTLVGRHQPLVALGPLEEAEVGELAAIVLGTAVDDRLDVLDDHTAGMPGLVRLVLAAWVADGTVVGGRLAVEPGAPGPSLVAAGRGGPAAAAGPHRARSADRGADLDDELGATTDLAPDRLAEAVDALHAAGLVTPHGDAVPVVAAAVNELAPVAERRRFHARLAAALAERGAPPPAPASTWRPPGRKALRWPRPMWRPATPRSARPPSWPRLVRAGLAAGTPATAIAARRAEAAALGGDAVAALRLADAVVADPEAPDRRRLAVVAALLPGRGFWRRSSRRFAELAATAGGDQNGRGVAAAGRIGGVATGGSLPAGPSGRRFGRGRRRRQCGRAGDRGAPADGRAVTAAPGQGTPPLVAALEAAELLESAHTTLVLPTSPHAVGATVALALCELDTAEHLLTRARDHDVGGASLRHHHRLGLGWVAAQRPLDRGPGRAGRGGGGDAAPGDPAGPPSRPAWPAAPATSPGWATPGPGRRGPPHPADLFSLEVVGELAIGAARLGLWDRVAQGPRARRRGAGPGRAAAVLPRCGGSACRWRWPPTTARQRCAGRRRSRPPSRSIPAWAPWPRRPAPGWRSWAAPPSPAAWRPPPAGSRAGADVGGVRLTGQAAIRSADPSVTRALLEQARDLKAAAGLRARRRTQRRERPVGARADGGAVHRRRPDPQGDRGPALHLAQDRRAPRGQDPPDGASTRAEMLAALRTHLAS